MSKAFDKLALGRPTEYVSKYTPSLLQSIPRADLRAELRIAGEALPFRGVDVWTSYELSWLNLRGKPEIAVVRIHVPCNSAGIMESKSLKLYLLSFSQTDFSSRAEVQRTLESDISVALHSPVIIQLLSLDQLSVQGLGNLPGQCLDTLDTDVRHYEVEPELLRLESSQQVRESLFSHLLRTRCPVTGQPDWGSVHVHYSGAKIEHVSLLRYIISYRNEEGFHEQTVERMFTDILNRCQPDMLTVQARFNRRGGIEINPFRSNQEDEGTQVRLPRQ
ncbi:MAG: NADPH-dependent 7-cyano-7-deazaguanine reductase QueF [Pseudomonadales bacterium]